MSIFIGLTVCWCKNTSHEYYYATQKVTVHTCAWAHTHTHCTNTHKFMCTPMYAYLVHTQFTGDWGWGGCIPLQGEFLLAKNICSQLKLDPHCWTTISAAHRHCWKEISIEVLNRHLMDMTHCTTQVQTSLGPTAIHYTPIHREWSIAQWWVR